METPKKNNAPRTYTTLKECSEDPLYREIYERLVKDTREMILNHYYDD